MKKIVVLFLTVSMFFSACSSGQEILKSVGDVLGTSGDGPVTELQVIQGLKQALEVGITKGAGVVSQLDGYNGNANIRIPFPPDVQKVENTLRDLGLGNEIDKLVVNINRGAEEAAKGAAKIFISSIQKMTITDAMSILKGENNAATNFLKRTTTQELYNSFRPVIETSLNQVGVTRNWDDIVGKYNKVPFVKKVNPDLADYVTNQALDGLFFMVEKEEAKIRKDPLARTTDILKRVFKLQDN
ncbi:MAG: DUF4197 domain-containing protein [Chitinophagales bacterium]